MSRCYTIPFCFLTNKTAQDR